MIAHSDEWWEARRERQAAEEAAERIANPFDIAPEPKRPETDHPLDRLMHANSEHEAVNDYEYFRRAYWLVHKANGTYRAAYLADGVTRVISAEGETYSYSSKPPIGYKRLPLPAGRPSRKMTRDKVFIRR